MTGQEAIDLIQNRFGQRTGIDETWILLELNNAQKRLELGPTTPWFLDTKGSLSTEADTQTVSAPSGFLRELDFGVYAPDSAGDVKEIAKNDYRILRSNNDLYKTNAFPEHYDLINGVFYFFPTPDAVYTVEYWYTAAGDVIVVGNETHWMLYTPELVLAEAMVPIARYLRDEGMVQLAQSDVGRESQRLITATVAYREANHSRYMGSAQ